MWMFGSRTTVKKVRNSLTWFSHYRELLNSASQPTKGSIRESSGGTVWLSLSVRKTKSKEERESFMRAPHPTTEERLSLVVLVLQFD